MLETILSKFRNTNYFLFTGVAPGEILFVVVLVAVVVFVSTIL